MDIFKLLGTIIVNNKDANKALDDTSNKGKDAESKLSKAFSSIGKGAVVLGKTVMTGLAAGATAMGTLTVKALNLSGELEQNMGGSEAVFGQYADKMQSKAKEAFSNMGLSTSDYLATANKMGALFQGAGFSIEESMNLSSDAMQRAADVASIMGIDTSAAMEAVAGAAKGNFTMMDNLGVAMNDTTLNAYALEKGINKTTQEMTAQEKTALAMEMFLDKTAYAAGNYAKENETLAGSLGTAKAALTNFLDGSGSVDQLVTAFSNAATVIVDNVSQIAPRLISGISELIGKVIPMVPPLLQQMLPVIITGAVNLINGLISQLPAMLDMLTISVIPQLLTGFLSVTEALISALPGLVMSICSALPVLLPQLITGVVTLVVMLCSNFSQIIMPIIEILPSLIVSIVDALLTNLPLLIQGVLQLIIGLAQAIPALCSALWESIKGIFTTLASKILGFFEPVKTAISNAWTAIGNVPGLAQLKTMIEKVWAAIKTHITTVITAIKNVLTTYWNSIKDVISTVINSIKNVISTVWNAIKTIISSVMKIISSVLKGDWEGVKSAITSIINAIKSVISSVWNAIKNVISSILSGIKNNISSVWNAISSVISSVVNTVKNVVTSVWNGIKSTTSAVFNGIKSTASSAWNDIKSKITTPIEKARDLVKNAIDRMKSFFNFSWSLPKLKLPHFTFSGKFSLNPPSVPKFSLQWYKKAMMNPMLLTSPTIFGYDAKSGSFQGAGEAGAEVVSGASTLMSMIGSVVESKMFGLSEQLIAVLTAILNAIVEGNEETIQAILDGHVIKIGEREFGRVVREYA